MKRATKISTTAITIMVMMLSMVGCSGPKSIPDSDLVNIFHDAFLANAYIDESKISEDSLLLYEPILERYGYSVEDMQFTVRTIASRKSSRLSDLVSDASKILEEESKLYNYQLMVLDTIDNVAERRYTRVVYRDTLIKVNRLKDTSKLQITIGDIIPAEYTVEFTYFIDTTDQNRNSRIEAYLVLNDGGEAARNTLMFSRYREGKYTRRFTADTSHKELYINMFYHPKSEDIKRPGIKITDFTVTRVIPTEQAVDSLYDLQMGATMFNARLMTSFNDDKPKTKAQRTTKQKSSTATKVGKSEVDNREADDKGNSRRESNEK